MSLNAGVLSLPNTVLQSDGLAVIALLSRGRAPMFVADGAAARTSEAPAAEH